MLAIVMFNNSIPSPQELSDSKQPLKNAVYALNPNIETEWAAGIEYIEGLNAAEDFFFSSGRTLSGRIIVFLSDGRLTGLGDDTPAKI